MLIYRKMLVYSKMVVTAILTKREEHSDGQGDRLGKPAKIRAFFSVQQKRLNNRSTPSSVLFYIINHCHPHYQVLCSTPSIDLLHIKTGVFPHITPGVLFHFTLGVFSTSTRKGLVPHHQEVF